MLEHLTPAALKVLLDRIIPRSWPRLGSTSKGLVLVTANKPKLQEYRALLGNDGLESSGYDLDDIADVSIEAVAKRKLEDARKMPDLKRRSFFLEASGLIVSTWNGMPGGLTKYFVDHVRCDGICKMMSACEGEKRAAEAQTVIYASIRGKTVGPFVGKVKGSIAVQPRGGGGFGWDPIFVPEGENKTFAELGEAKDRLSPRADACKELRAYLKAEGLLS